MEAKKQELPATLNKRVHVHKKRASETSFVNRKYQSRRKHLSKISVDDIDSGLDFVRSPSLNPGTARPVPSKRKSVPSFKPKRSSQLLPQISERDDTKHYSFKGLNTQLNAQELERYKMKYFDSDSVWQRLLPFCSCEFCKGKSVGFDPLLKRVKTPYGSIPDKTYTFKKSFSLYSSNMDLTLNNGSVSVDLKKQRSSTYAAVDVDLKQQQSILGGCCTKEETTPLITVMGLGMKNNKHNFMHMLNDINSKMILCSRLLVYMHQKSAPHLLGLTLSPISDEEPEPIERARTMNDMPLKRAKHESKQSLSSVSHDSAFSHDAVSPLSNGDSGPNSDELPILKVRRLSKIRALHAAIRTYHRRLAKPLDFNPERYMIQDNVSEIVDIVKVMTHVVKCFTKGHLMPFQIDVAIIPKGVTAPNTTKMDVISSDEEDDDDDDDDESLHTDDEFDEEEKDNTRETKAKRCVISDDIGEMLQHGLFPKHHDSFHKNCIPLIRSDEGIHLFKESICNNKIDLFSQKHHMQNGRYVIIVDRRKGNPKKSLPVITPSKSKKKEQHNKTTTTDDCSDYMYVFQPPKPYGEIIDYTTMVETLHLNTLECLIPKRPQHPLDEKNKEDEEQFIGAKDVCQDTQMMCVSFHVLSQNEIRCYLYIDQKYMRIDHWEVLGEILRDNYVLFDPEGPSQPHTRTKYKEFAFDTKDKQFDKYFHWAQNHQRPDEFRKSRKNVSPNANGAHAIEITTAALNDD